MGTFVGRLDAGWKVYADLIGKGPSAHRVVNGKPVVAAVPDIALTCGMGCGYVGATGIEVGGFYAGDYDLVKKDPAAFPHYYFYEMGRNYFVFGDRHSLFTTGYAVFMRYVVMDAFKCTDPDAPTRETIEGCEDRYARWAVKFLDVFTNLGPGRRLLRSGILPSNRDTRGQAPVLLRRTEKCLAPVPPPRATTTEGDNVSRDVACGSARPCAQPQQSQQEPLLRVGTPTSSIHGEPPP